MKKWSLFLAVCLLLAMISGCSGKTAVPDSVPAEKPVIYLYPEEETEVTVTLDYAGTILSAYPDSDGSWTVTATPDGTLTDRDGREYGYLFWEGVSDAAYDFRRGFVVSGADTEAFLEDSLAVLGLTDKEAGEFITYWLPRMQDNPYNLIAFQGKAYTDAAVLTVSPRPDSVIRVFMAYKALEAPVDLPEQELPRHERTGFTVVEWGGAEVAGS